MLVHTTVADELAVVSLAHGDRNALSVALLDELASTCDALGRRDDVRALVLSSAAARVFSVGVDHDVLRALDEAAAKALVRAGQRAVNALSDAPIPTLAAVHGAAMGGGWELALACDFVLASRQALFALPEVNLGLVPAFGGLHRLITLAGPMRALELAASGRTINAEAALSYGLVLDVVAPADLLPAARALGDRLLAKSASSLRTLKQAMRLEVDAARTALQDADHAAFSVSGLTLPR